MSKVIGISFADLHMHKYTQFSDPVEGINGRLFQSLLVLSYIAQVANHYKVPIFFPGDFFETQSGLENQVGSLAMNAYKKCIADRGLDFYCISGNHDMSERNGLDHKSPTHLDKFKVFKGFTSLDDLTCIITKDSKMLIQGVPYMDNDSDTLKSIQDKAKSTNLAKGAIKILMLHQDFPGAKTPAGFECKEYKALNTDLDKLFKPWDFVLCGHIHKPQKIAKNAWMLGSPIQQISSDEGTKMGYWKMYSDKTMKFVPLNKKFPVFRTIKHNETAYNDKDYFIRLPADDLVEKKIKKDKFSLNNSKDKLATEYLAQKGIKSKKKLTALKKILSEV